MKSAESYAPLQITLTLDEIRILLEYYLSEQKAGCFTPTHDKYLLVKIEGLKRQGIGG